MTTESDRRPLAGTMKRKHWFLLVAALMLLGLIGYRFWGRTCAELDRGNELQSFFSRVVPADSLEVTTTMGPDGPRVLFSVKGAAEVAELIRRITFRRHQLVGHCMCTGSMAIRFYCGHVPVETVTWHHGVSLRFFRTLFPVTATRPPWISLLEGNAELTAASALSLEEWFAEKGFPLGEGEKISRQEHLDALLKLREMLQKALESRSGQTVTIHYIEETPCRVNEVEAWLAEVVAEIDALEARGSMPEARSPSEY